LGNGEIDKGKHDLGVFLASFSNIFGSFSDSDNPIQRTHVVKVNPSETGYAAIQNLKDLMTVGFTGDGTNTLLTKENPGDEDMKKVVDIYKNGMRTMIKALEISEGGPDFRYFQLKDRDYFYGQVQNIASKVTITEEQK